MARTITTIYDSLIAEKNSNSVLSALQPSVDDAQTLLSDLTSTSKVARWRLMLWVVAFGIWIHEALWDETKKEIEQIAANVVPGTTRWYARIALQFQLGYQLLYLNDKFQYAQVDANAQIVKRAAAIDLNGQVLIKVAKIVSNQVTPLTTTELAAFEAYINQIKYAGVATIIVSRNADLLKLVANVYYDPQVLDANGQIINTASKPVEDAINAYVSGLPFNGELLLSKLVDAIQAAQGVKDVVIVSAHSKVGTGPYNPIAVSYTSDAGHMAIDPANPLTSTITYIADPNV